MAEAAQQLQLVDRGGACDEGALREFCGGAGRVGVAGHAYAVVAVMGPQSSGKSTLLNALYGTRFVEMDAMSGRGQTTKGIWLAQAVPAQAGGVLPLVMDLEGTDGRERGEDDAAFEAQSALFALAAADVLLVNMWTHDVGREHGAGKPLLRTVLQAHTRLFAPTKRSTLLFVLRDKTRTPVERLEEILREDLNAIWEGVTKPDDRQDAALADYFDVRVAALSSLEHAEDAFRTDVAALRAQVDGYIADAAARQAHVPGDAFALSTKSLWDQVAANDDLNLPAHKVMVATVRCAEIASAQLALLQADEDVAAMVARAMGANVPDFGVVLSAAVDAAQEAYDEDAKYYDAAVSQAAREKLRKDAFAAFSRAHGAQLRFAAAAAEERLVEDLKAVGEEGFADAAAAAVARCLETFTEAAVAAEPQGSGWEHTEAYRSLVDATKTRVHAATEALVDRATTDARGAVREVLEPAVAALLEDLPDDLWEQIREVVATAGVEASDLVRSKIEGAGVDAQAIKKACAAAEKHARDLAEELVRRASKSAAALMRDRFSAGFHRDERGLPRTWGASDDVASVAEAARRSAAKALSIMALLRLDTSATSAESEEAITRATSALARGETGACSGLAWKGVDASVVLLQPAACRQAWKRFDSDAAAQVSQALAAQEARRSAAGVPAWAIVAMLVLGWNELWALLTNPLLLVFVAVLAYVGSKLWIELDAQEKLKKGLIPGVVLLSCEVVPALTRLMGEWLRAMADSAEAAGQVDIAGAAGKAKVEPPVERHAGNAESIATAGGGGNSDGVRRRTKRAD